MANDDFAKSIGAVPIDDEHADFANSIGATPVATAPVPSGPSPVENPHDLVPFLKNQAAAAGNLVSSTGSGAINAVMNPTQTASDIANSVASSPSDYAEGAYRMIRNIPIAGPAINNIVSDVHALAGGPEAEKKYQDEIEQSDKLHAEQHPLTDFIQRSAGMIALPQAAIAKIAVMTTDAFQKSMAEGNDTLTALKDARNVALLSGVAISTGKLLSKGMEEGAEKFAEKVGVPAEAIDEYGADRAAPSFKDVEGPIPNFPTKEQLSYANTGIEPLPAAAEAPAPLNPVFEAGNNEGDYFAKLGQKAGAGAGGLSGYVLGHGWGSAAGVPAGMMVGKFAGSLVDKYGAPAVKVALDAGIGLEKIAETPWIGPIMEAAANGPKALAIAHYILSQTDSGYAESQKQSP